MKRYRYRKVTPKIKERMRKLRKKGMAYRKIGEILGLGANTIMYHLNPEQKEKAIKRALETYHSLSKKEIAIKQKKRIKYKSDYYMDRYHHDPEFRARVISQIVKWQRKKRAEKYDNKKKG